MGHRPIGIFLRVDPTFLTVDQATPKVTADLQAALSAKPTARPKMPKFSWFRLPKNHTQEPRRSH